MKLVFSYSWLRNPLVSEMVVFIMVSKISWHEDGSRARYSSLVQ